MLGCFFSYLGGVFVLFGGDLCFPPLFFSARLFLDFFSKAHHTETGNSRSERHSEATCLGLAMNTGCIFQPFALRRALRRMAGLAFCLFSWALAGACSGRSPKARRGRVYSAIHRQRFPPPGPRAMARYLNTPAVPATTRPWRCALCVHDARTGATVVFLMAPSRRRCRLAALMAPSSRTS